MTAPCPDRSREPLISVIIPGSKRRRQPRTMPRRLSRLSPPLDPIEIIVADNGSTDDSREVARSFGATVLHLPDVPCLDAEKSRPACRAWDPLIALIDADNQISAGWLAAVLPHLRQRQCGGDWSRLLVSDGGTWVQKLYDGFRRHPESVQPVRWLASGNMVVRRSAALEIERFRRVPRNLRRLRLLQPSPLARLPDPGRSETREHRISAILRRSNICSRASCGGDRTRSGSACGGCTPGPSCRASCSRSSRWRRWRSCW